MVSVSGSSVVTYILSPSECLQPRVSSHWLSGYQAHVHPLTLRTGESWPSWLPGTEHRGNGVGVGATEFHFCFHLDDCPAL